jgi:hypothetical protein
MNLKFIKNDNEELQVFIKTQGDEKKFNYIDMIQTIYKERNMDDPEFEGNILDKEKEIIKNMIIELKKVIL